MRLNAPLLALTAISLQAATVRGTVVENQTGHPLARATVTLQLLGGGTAQSVRTNAYGIFEFPALKAGAYLVSATRLAFAPVQYGQKRWYSSGMPVSLADSDSAVLTIRLPRYGAIVGTVLDENDVGLPDHQVAVYTNARPPALLARARTDDRGVYRFFGLRPGSYLVRSLSKVYEDESYLPTFYRDSGTVDQSRTIDVTLDEEVDRADFHAATGRLFTVSGSVNGPPGAMVTLASDTGRENASTDSNGEFRFNPTAPGQYELLAVAPGGPRGQMAALRPITVDRDLTVRMPLGFEPTLQIVLEDSKGQPLDGRQLKVMARRQDLAGDSQAETLPASGTVSLLPGRWELAIAPDSSYCVVGFTPSDAASPGRADGWNEIVLASGPLNVAKFVLSSSPATVSGTVKNSGGEPVAGVPVFLEPYDLDPRKRLATVRTTRTNAQGHYGFAGLAPGAYRLLASFDYQMPDPSQLDAANAKTVKVQEGGREVLDLEEFVIH